jgi:serine/threonine kinase 32
MKANPKFHVTSPPVSMSCLHGISSLLEKDTSKRIGAAGFETFTQNVFFQPIDFDALERKEIPPIFRPSSEKTNFDATYDLEELLLEEAPLEARARKQKPRAELKDDATDKEIREDELHRMIETMFEPFDYTMVSFDKVVPEDVDECLPPTDTTITISQSRSTNISPSGSPPLQADMLPAPSKRSDYFPTLEEATTATSANTPPIEHSSPTRSYSRPIPPQRARGATRKSSRGGGVQMTLDEHGSWTELANQSATMPAEGLDGAKGRDGKGQSGMLGFLSRKKGRDRSPKPQEPGVLGKEGARHIIS